jgi:hypothetical protein
MTNPAPTPRTRKPEVTTRAFERAHGKTPRGIGNWAFAPTTHHTAFHTEVDYNAAEWFYGTYSEARTRAQWHFAERGVHMIAALS